MPEDGAVTPEVEETEAAELEVTEETDAEVDSQEESQEADDWRKGFDPDKAMERIKKLQSENKNLRTRAKSAEEKADGAEEKDSRIASLEKELLRERVARKLNLPDALIDRLRGDTEDDLLDDAQKLIGLVSGGKPKPANPDAGARVSAPTQVSDDDLSVEELINKYHK